MRVHLVSPAFHGYWRAMAGALTARGHAVTTHRYDEHPTLPDRLWHHARHELPRRVGVGQHRRLTREQTSGAVASLRDARPEAVIVVKGDALTEVFWDHLLAAGLPRVTWLYDEVRRTRFSPDALARIGPIATYSALDHADFIAHGWDSRHLPLAYDHRLVETPSGRRHGDVVFVGARYPAREQVLTRLADARVPVRAYGRDWSSHPVDRLRTWRLHGAAVPAGRDLDRARAYDVMAEAVATLNLHGDQDGFTMRTFEASGVGGLQLIDRADVAGLYEPDEEVLVWRDFEHLLELCGRATSDHAWADRIRQAARRRTLAEHTFDHRMAILEAAWDTV